MVRERTGPSTPMEIPPLSQELLVEFTSESLILSASSRFDPKKVLRHLQGVDRVYMGIDMGGDKITARKVRIRQGEFLQEDDDLVQKSQNGEGYLDFLHQVAEISNNERLPVGLSFAGPMEEGKPQHAANMMAMFRELQTEYSGHLERVLPRLVSVKNDATACLISSSVALCREGRDFENFLLIILGGGLGAAVLQDDKIIGTEAGHLKVPDDLNPFQVREICETTKELQSKSHTCLELVAGGVAGLEKTASKVYGKRVTGIELAKMAAQGDETAKRLYMNAAGIVGHVILGLGNLFSLPLGERDHTAVVFHGGVQKAFGFPEWEADAIRKYLGRDLDNVFQTTSIVSSNACLEGAAVAACLAA
ncbi:hypothetical protein A3G67_04005 [Candidatus Roizmanbacteria bacterium RIFCSPLOWO2_12_FULL_40_12]|uniref:ROK family protein n=1 Tax=Candidatus Roizmanbacteria bacterium RIFCSPLOWO2_01_FULL_40_42 TaxID=1802066 RepID=A0A1F7J2C1_9BACT|nr:MAG: hypothetical protein A2779_01875 [Candidatus Roizmanbacteria bacterium RIFCSPHIGHO2_01_FULL_40_98]OGK27752.1 MAG: hypothetical protein A3C31_01385 [Candidatus Roizmanbacteria bacterium RIFCSPHIGHO2_02_FULL_40_53]OGK30677.1 MAG: hypothetical protein A2W49_01570 [Candidatus Roizmanbacteria bacterium RIFCSPHIGHO2_12_41_18]OGK36499.1 MAG: hypothetical protein A3E69_04780 [Candidatus Roizmanbacteria bacterium RIFCSPHIGHO2_12_FULL_40_130]OGK49761.1 MAG: hypothetical protein A3B50_03955 [Candi